MKPPVKRIPSDDCEVTVDGEVYRPHENEWIEITPMGTVKSYLNARKLRRADVASLEDDDDFVEGILTSVANRVVDWNWTDMRGDPLPPPSRDSFELLTMDELNWLQRVVALGRSPGEQKNGSSPSTSPLRRGAKRQTNG